MLTISFLLGLTFRLVAEPPSAPSPPLLALEVTSELTLDTDASPDGFSYSSLVIDAGATLNVIGSNPLIINVDDEVKILGTIDLSGGKGGNSAGDHKAAGGGAGGGALKISAPIITVGPAGAIHADGGDGGDGGGYGQSFFGAATPWSTGAGNGAGGVGVAGGGAGGAGGGSGQPGHAGSGSGASAGGRYDEGVPPGAGGAGHAFAGKHGFGEYSGWKPAGGPAYGDVQLTGGLQGGSGAGGGGNDSDNEEGAGGGGSGGTIYLVAAALDIEGTLTAIGGLGGRDDYGYYHYIGGGNRECCNNGGAGSVGRIRLDYDTVTNLQPPPPPPPPPSPLPPPSLPNLVFELTESFDDEAQQRDAVVYNRAENSFVFDGSRSFVRLDRPIQDDFSISFELKTSDTSGESTAWYRGHGLVDAEVAYVQNDFGVTPP